MSIRKTSRARHPVEVMVNRKNARVIGKAFFGQDVQGPETFPRDRPTRRAIAVDSDPGSILDSPHRGASVLPEFVRRHRIDLAMPVAVTGKFVPARVHFSN